MQPLSGDDPVQIGRYRLRSRLGAGGMGNVYLASTPAGRPVALKVVRPELSHDQEFRARFHQEIQAARRVRGLYTAELVDADPEADPPWLATAYVPGPSLQQVLDTHGPMPEAEAFRLIAGVAEALQAIHSANVVHRDLKPSNVVLGPDGPRVIDFGIARALEGSALTRTGMTVGTPQFMAPEQFMEGPATPMIDVFALGSLAAYAALGRPPFGGGHPAAVYYRVVHEPPDLNGCTPQLRTLIEPCLAKQPADRPQLDQILRFCLERAEMTAGPALGQAPYRPAEATNGYGPTPVPAAPPGSAQPTVGTSSPGVTPSRLVPPQPVIQAVRLMHLGALLAVGRVGAAVATALPAVRVALHLHGAVSGETVAGTVLTGLVAAGVWLWMARAIKRGWNKAWPASILLFIINTISLLGGNAGGIANYATFAFDLAQWGAGLLVVLSLWDRRSTAYFAELNRARSLAIPEWPKRLWDGGQVRSRMARRQFAVDGPAQRQGAALRGDGRVVNLAAGPGVGTPRPVRVVQVSLVHRAHPALSRLPKDQAAAASARAGGAGTARAGRRAAGTIERGPTCWPPGSRAPASSNSTTPLHSRLHPCSGWVTTTRAAMRSGAAAAGQGGWCLHMTSSGAANPSYWRRGFLAGQPDGRDDRCASFTGSTMPDRAVTDHVASAHPRYLLAGMPG